MGLFRCGTERLAQWLAAGMGPDWVTRPLGATSLDVICTMLAPGEALSRQVLVPWRGWTAMLTDGPLGTDVGMIPSLAARELNCMGIRATAVDPQTDRFQAVVLEVFDPGASTDVLRCRRSIAAVDDGGRWTFGQTGTPFEFEDQSAYARRRVRDRFTQAMLTDYLRSLGVPVELDLELSGSVLLDRVTSKSRRTQNITGSGL